MTSLPGTIAVLERLADVLELVDEAGALVVRHPLIVPVLAPVDLLHPGLRRGCWERPGTTTDGRLE